MQTKALPDATALAPAEALRRGARVPRTSQCDDRYLTELETAETRLASYPLAIPVDILKNNFTAPACSIALASDGILVCTVRPRSKAPPIVVE
jgi:hypothetical protein